MKITVVHVDPLETKTDSLLLVTPTSLDARVAQLTHNEYHAAWERRDKNLIPAMFVRSRHREIFGSLFFFQGTPSISTIIQYTIEGAHMYQATSLLLPLSSFEKYSGNSTTKITAIKSGIKNFLPKSEYADMNLIIVVDNMPQVEFARRLFNI